jgi:pimeloyl-ACP methyl ester carboxylesterase
MVSDLIPQSCCCPGGSPLDRDETMFGHKPFRCLAAALHAEGFATLRMDDRGVGASGGKKLQRTLGELAQDAAACLDWLGQRPGVDRARLVVVGHSQGCYLGARVAATRGGVAGLVLLGAPGLPVGEVLARQLGEAWAKFVSELPAPEQEGAEAVQGKVGPQVRALFSAPMLRETLFHDPRPDLAAVPRGACLRAGMADGATAPVGSTAGSVAAAAPAAGAPAILLVPRRPSREGVPCWRCDK